MEITVAGTVQAFHLIPFYAVVEHRSITKSGANLHIFCISCKLFFNIFDCESDNYLIICIFASGIWAK